MWRTYRWPQEGQTPLVKNVVLKDGIGYYAGDPIGWVSIVSYWLGDGACYNSPQTMWVGLVALFDPITLRTPPFHVE